MPSIKRLVLDVLKPREVSLSDLSMKLCEIEGVDRVNIVVTEVDAKTETLKATLVGEAVPYELVCKLFQDNGCAVRSVDEIEVGRSEER